MLTIVERLKTENRNTVSLDCNFADFGVFVHTARRKLHITRSQRRPA